MSLDGCTFSGCEEFQIYRDSEISLVKLLIAAGFPLPASWICLGAGVLALVGIREYFLWIHIVIRVPDLPTRLVESSLPGGTPVLFKLPGNVEPIWAALGVWGTTGPACLLIESGQSEVSCYWVVPLVLRSQIIGLL